MSNNGHQASHAAGGGAEFEVRLICKDDSRTAEANPGKVKKKVL